MMYDRPFVKLISFTFYKQSKTSFRCFIYADHIIYPFLYPIKSISILFNGKVTKCFNTRNQYSIIIRMEAGQICTIKLLHFDFVRSATFAQRVICA